MIKEPVSRSECGNIFWTGGLSSGNNRWFDKSIQIMCTNNGKAGLIGEHSMMDGMPMIQYADYVTKNTYSDALQKSSASASASASSGATVSASASASSGGVENIFQDCFDSLSSGDSNVHSMVAKGKDDILNITIF